MLDPVCTAGLHRQLELHPSAFGARRNGVALSPNAARVFASYRPTTSGANPKCLDMWQQVLIIQLNRCFYVLDIEQISP